MGYLRCTGWAEFERNGRSPLVIGWLHECASRDGTKTHLDSGRLLKAGVCQCRHHRLAQPQLAERGVCREEACTALLRLRSLAAEPRRWRRCRCFAVALPMLCRCSVVHVWTLPLLAGPVLLLASAAAALKMHGRLRATPAAAVIAPAVAIAVVCAGPGAARRAGAFDCSTAAKLMAGGRGLRLRRGHCKDVQLPAALKPLACGWAASFRRKCVQQLRIRPAMLQACAAAVKPGQPRCVHAPRHRWQAARHGEATQTR